MHKDIYHFFSFDLGATSGRSILGVLQDGRLDLQELTRFANKILRIDNKYYWNIYSLFEELKKGLQTAQEQGVELDSIGIDSWGVDFVCVGRDGSFLGFPRSYRDPYTWGIAEEYFTIIPKKDVYKCTGIQVMDFNSLYQLYAAKKEHCSALENAESILFIPDALIYLLTGRQICEYTIASTSQFINPVTKQVESRLLAAAGIHSALLPPLVLPGTVVGSVRGSIQKECKVGDIPVVAVGGHDTASAVVAVPAEDQHFAYLSSGTWSLMGIELKEPIINEKTLALNFTNEGGVEGTTRLLKNITGMWLLEQCRQEWETEGTNYTYPEIVRLSGSVDSFQFLIDPDAPAFSNPESMTQAIVLYCKATGQESPCTHAEFIRCIFDSLALKYKYVLDCLQELAPFKIERLHVIGGGSQNKLLNQATANAVGIPVIAGPSEATAIGNIMMQAKALGLVKSLKEIRTIVRNSVDFETYYPQETGVWHSAYTKFLSIIKKRTPLIP